MKTYRLDQLEGGIVVLPSGGWRWYVIRLNALPEGTCELQHLIFVSEQEGGGIMRSRVPSDIDSVDDADVEQYARHPEDRMFKGPRGWITLWPPTVGVHDPMWKVRPEKGIPFRTSFAIEKSLGELTSQDLRQIASSQP